MSYCNINGYFLSFQGMINKSETHRLGNSFLSTHRLCFADV